MGESGRQCRKAEPVGDGEHDAETDIAVFLVFSDVQCERLLIENTVEFVFFSVDVVQGRRIHGEVLRAVRIRPVGDGDDDVDEEDVTG